MEKASQVLQCTEKNFPCFFFSTLFHSKFYIFFNVSLCEINCIKIQTMSLASKSIYFSRDSLCFIYFDVIIGQQLKKSSS